MKLESKSNIIYISYYLGTSTGSLIAFSLVYGEPGEPRKPVAEIIQDYIDMIPVIFEGRAWRNHFSAWLRYPIEPLRDNLNLNFANNPKLVDAHCQRGARTVYAGACASAQKGTETHHIEIFDANHRDREDIQ